ncbi:MAG: hypothetical protein R2713_13680 [Ilumatobacteraceae bacterium]
MHLLGQQVERAQVDGEVALGGTAAERGDVMAELLHPLGDAAQVLRGALRPAWRDAAIGADTWARMRTGVIAIRHGGRRKASWRDDRPGAGLKRLARPLRTGC